MENNAFVFYNPTLPPPPLPGQVPQLYREAFDTITVSSSSKIPKSLWLKVVATANISESVAAEVRGQRCSDVCTGMCLLLITVKFVLATHWFQCLQCK